MASKPRITTLHLHALQDLGTSSETLTRAEDAGFGAETIPTVHDEPGWKPSKQTYLIIAVLAVLSLMAALDCTVLVPALSAIAGDLNGSATDTFWAGTSFLLTSAIFQPMFANLSNIFGRQPLLLCALAFFTAGSLIACLAQSFPVLLVGRSIQGVGGGGIASMVMVIFAEIVPLKQRPRYFALVQMAWALGTISGPVIGGLFVEKATWRWIFYINFPFCAIGFATVPWIVRLKSPVVPLGDKLNKIDWVGTGIFIFSMTTLLVGITAGGVQYPWSSWKVLLLIWLGVVGAVGTFFWSRQRTIDPFLNLEVVRPWSTFAVYFCGLLQGLILFALGYYVAFYLQSVKSLSPLLTGVGGLPLFGGLLPTTVACGLLIAHTGHYRWSIWSGWLVTTCGAGLLCLLSQATSTGVWAGILVVEGLGQGMILGALLIAAQAAAATADVTHATAMFNFMRSLGMCFGVAIGGTVFQNMLSHYLGDAGLPQSIASDAEGYLLELEGMPTDALFRHAVLDQYAKAFQIVFAVLAGVGALGSAASMAIRGHSLEDVRR